MLVGGLATRGRPVAALLPGRTALGGEGLAVLVVDKTQDFGGLKKGILEGRTTYGRLTGEWREDGGTGGKEEEDG